MIHANRIVSAILSLTALAAGTILATAQTSADPAGDPGDAQIQSSGGRPVPESVAVAYKSQLWPAVNGVATVYYKIDSASDPNATPKINSAINTFNADFPGVIQWVPWTSPNTQGPNYVDINLSATDLSGQCEALEGYEAVPAQKMWGSTSCVLGTILHEMGHVIGLWHEQSRKDRASYISVSYANVIKGSWPDFEIVLDDHELLTPYDYASLMQYPAFSFSRKGSPVIESIPAGIPLGGAEGLPQLATDYSAADKEGILRLYGAAPKAVTITSNPVGLQVIVDGLQITTPQTYAWALNSSHTLSVPSSVQTLSGNIESSNVATTFYYTYGRWNDSATETHTIAIAPGNGGVGFPTAAPKVSTYSANFVQLVPYAASVFPSSTGTVTVSPAPKTYAGETAEFFVARQHVTLTATQATGWKFYEFNNAPFWLPGALGLNPKAFYVPDTGNPVNTTVEFSNTPIYTVNASPNSATSNLYAYVDGNFSYLPRNFSSSYDSTWTPKSMHSLSMSSPEYPYSSNSRFVFSKWSDGGAMIHSIASLPATAATYTATLTPDFAPATNFGYPPCGGSASISPASPTNDGFYPSGQILTYDVVPDTGWTFAGWSFDLTGTANPATLKATDETLVYANFNTANAPLTLTSLTPGTAAAGGKSFTLTLAGTGFTPSSLVSVNGTYRSVTFVSSTKLSVVVTAADIATAANFPVFVENFPAGWTGCAVFGSLPFFVY